MISEIVGFTVILNGQSGREGVLAILDPNEIKEVPEISGQTVNATGVGSLPWTWAVDEQVIDLLHKGIYAFVTGAVADQLIKGPEGIPAPRKP